MRLYNLCGRFAVAALAAFLASCGGSDSTAPGSSTEFDLPTDFPITVSSGTTPTISWTGSTADNISLIDESTNTFTQDIVWEFSTKLTSQGVSVGVPSPVRYGTMPSTGTCNEFGDVQCPAALPLVKGHVYEVLILATNGKLGAKLFSP